MKTYDVTFQETTFWTITVQANDQNEAECLAWDLSNSDRESFGQSYGDTTISDVEEVGQ